jgi:hypothetical protein
VSFRLEVQDLEDEVAGLETRLKKIQDELAEVETSVSDKPEHDQGRQGGDQEVRSPAGQGAQQPRVRQR